MTFTSYVTLPAHTHTISKNSSIPVSEIQILVCKTAYFPEISRRFLVFPVLGLIFTIFLIYRRCTVMRDAYSKLEYTPNKNCMDKLCSRLHPKYHFPLIAFGILGGIGALTPLLILGIVMHLILKILKKFAFLCEHTQKCTYSLFPSKLRKQNLS
ncbi:hypothetical protein CCA_00339 [Chlamydia caviae GPIC]|uniref:Uncharacterized protein n=1 Tax=Chlamydia caviae (strain ATCC VR-813 / DSM 19441 / 03DC25 / GPIC) TaxID=227941 RepID=Q823R7_CHLCV|nr:hypothetical protein CCA_00339 [Chlamydia caviae GPIC]